jgi:hypothetical protein
VAALPTPVAGALLHHFASHPAEEESIGLGDVLGRVTVQVFVRDHHTIFAAPVQSDVDGVPQAPHCVRVRPTGENWQG